MSTSRTSQTQPNPDEVKLMRMKLKLKTSESMVNAINWWTNQRESMQDQSLIVHFLYTNVWALFDITFVDSGGNVRADMTPDNVQLVFYNWKAFEANIAQATTYINSASASRDLQKQRRALQMKLEFRCTAKLSAAKSERSSGTIAKQASEERKWDITIGELRFMDPR